MNHLDADEHAMVRERPEDYPVSTREDELRQQAARGHVAAQERPPEKVGVRAASQKLSQLVQRAKGGEIIVITVDGKVSAQLCPVVPRITCSCPGDHDPLTCATTESRCRVPATNAPLSRICGNPLPCPQHKEVGQ